MNNLLIKHMRESANEMAEGWLKQETANCKMTTDLQSKTTDDGLFLVAAKREVAGRVFILIGIFPIEVDPVSSIIVYDSEWKAAATIVILDTFFSTDQIFEETELHWSAIKEALTAHFANLN